MSGPSLIAHFDRGPDRRVILSLVQKTYRREMLSPEARGYAIWNRRKAIRTRYRIYAFS